ncbi:GreA/GreB family elongation factor [Pseudoflavitalea rhizosphaerae]|uniref:GreA/GreB family elongation factor n=1 Tax=Pseudoflavitalea rhizosphaerae TaxID=1884793 RepID=UPI000F8DC3FB|nr:GreA/GreB family elongation factor [Pseudoflavitalea rhizosphaerae]
MSHIVIVLQEDFQLLTSALNTDNHFLALSEDEKSKIKNKLANAQQVSAADFPNNVSRLYDIITLRNIKTRQNVQFKLVPPAERDSWSGKISALSPLGIALLGVVKGQSISWQSGNKKNYYTVMEVSNAVFI